MENIVLIVHLIIALFLIAVVLLQRSEGGALGIGGGGGGMVSARGAATALSKITWALAIAFICTSIILTSMAGGRTGSIVETPELGEGDTVPLPTIPTPTDGDGGIPLPTAPGN